MGAPNGGIGIINGVVAISALQIVAEANQTEDQGDIR